MTLSDGLIAKDSYMDGKTNVVTTQFTNRLKDTITASEIDMLKKDLDKSYALKFCSEGTIESQTRKAGVIVKFNYIDKAGLPIHSAIYSNETCDEKVQKSKLLALESSVKKAASQIEILRNVGEGEVTTCDLQYGDERLKIGFANINKVPEVVVTAIGQHVVNLIRLNLDKNSVTELVEKIDSVQANADKLSEIETLRLGQFQTRGGSIRFSSQYGIPKAFFTSDGTVDRVLISPDINELIYCLTETRNLL